MLKKTIYISFLLISFHLASQNKPFWNEIQTFRALDSISPAKDGMVLFIGSSSFRLWKSASDDFHNSSILNRAFGGATLLDMINYQQDVVLKYRPKKIFIYCGENDIASSEAISPEMVCERFKTLFKSIRTQFPQTPIIYVSIKPCILRWVMKDRMIATNTLIQSFLNTQKNTTFVNVWDKMLDNGEPIKDIFIEDHLHMNSKGYAIWVNELYQLVNN